LGTRGLGSERRIPILNFYAQKPAKSSCQIGVLEPR
jgi:hypothetical protein